MSHLLAEFSPATERTDVAATVPALLAFARKLGLHGTVNIVGADATRAMKTIEPEQQTLPERIAFSTTAKLVAIAEGKAAGVTDEEMDLAKKELERRAAGVIR